MKDDPADTDALPADALRSGAEPRNATEAGQSTAGQSAVDPEVEAQLVAYLDGELDAEACRRVEAMLADDAEIQARLQRLDGTWALLDRLKALDVSEDLTQSTLEMVAAAAEDELHETQQRAARRRPWRRLLIAASLMVVALAGFLAAMPLVPNENRQLVKDFALLTDLDHYRQLDNVEFIESLHAEGLFPTGEEDAESEALSARERIERMDPIAMGRLQRARRQFAALPAQRQEQLRGLRRQLDEQEHAAALRQVMHDYHQWLKTLPAFERAELAGLKPDERIERIKELRTRQLEDQATRPSEEDIEGLARWLETLSYRHEQRVLTSLPPEARQQWDDLADPIRRWAIVLASLRYFGGGWPPRPIEQILSEQDLADLRAELPAATCRRLEVTATAEQWATVSRWIRQEIVTGRYVPEAVEADLDAFCIEELPKEEQARLIGYSERWMRLQLWRMYCTARFGPNLFFQFRPGGPPGGPPGGSGGLRRGGDGTGRRGGPPGDGTRPGPPNAPGPGPSRPGPTL